VGGSGRGGWPGRRLKESERSGGGGGRLDLRKEMLLLVEREEEELDLLWFSRGEEVLLSGHS